MIERLAANPAPRLSDDDAADLEVFAVETRRGAENTTPQERRLIIKRLQLVGTVRRDDEHGRKLKRRNRFSTAWANVLTSQRHDEKIVNVQSVVVNDPSGTSATATKVGAAIEQPLTQRHQ